MKQKYFAPLEFRYLHEGRHVSSAIGDNVSSHDAAYMVRRIHSHLGGSLEISAGVAESIFATAARHKVHPIVVLYRVLAIEKLDQYRQRGDSRNHAGQLVCLNRLEKEANEVLDEMGHRVIKKYQPFKDIANAALNASLNHLFEGENTWN